MHFKTEYGMSLSHFISMEKSNVLFNFNAPQSGFSEVSLLYAVELNLFFLSALIKGLGAYYAITDNTYLLVVCSLYRRESHYLVLVHTFFKTRIPLATMDHIYLEKGMQERQRICLSC